MTNFYAFYARTLLKYLRIFTENRHRILAYIFKYQQINITKDFIHPRRNCEYRHGCYINYHCWCSNNYLKTQKLVKLFFFLRDTQDYLSE